MDSLLNQLPALLGVIVGTLATILATNLADRARWRRDRSVRWDERRLDAYAEYARAIKELHLLTFRLTAARRPAALAQPVDRDIGLKMLAQAEAHRTKAWEAVLLVGDAATVTAAGRWRDAVWQLERLAVDSGGDGDEWMPAVEAADGARDRFYVAARGSLAIAGEAMVQSPGTGPGPRWA